MKNRNQTESTPLFAVERRTSLKRFTVSLGTIILLAAAAAFVAFAANDSSESAAQTFVKEIPPGYRDWKLVSVAHEEGTLNDIRAILGNDVAVTAYREGKLPFPDGAIIARLAWEYLPSEENNKVFGRRQSFVAGHPTNGVQFMVKDSKKYAATGGWGFAHFNDGVSADDTFMQSCFPCHQAIKPRDLVFTRYSR